MAWSIHNGLAVYRLGQGDPIFLMPGPHRFARPGLPMTDALIDGLTGVDREVITFDPARLWPIDETRASWYAGDARLRG